MSSGSTDAKRRVKLYALNASRQWDDQGTGHVTSCYHEPLDGMSLLVRNESDGSLLLESKIQLDTQYVKQQGTLIVWNDGDNHDLALSFQEQDGCNEIWEKICQVQGRDPTYENDQDDEQEEVRIDLVECEPDKLDDILEQIQAFSQTTRRKDALATEYVENDYISKLLQIFKQADDMQDLSILYKLYRIFLQLFLYDRPTLTEIMLGDSVLMDVIGVFEYEPPANFDHQQTHQDNSDDETDSDVNIADHDRGPQKIEQEQIEDAEKLEDEGTNEERVSKEDENVEKTIVKEKPQIEETTSLQGVERQQNVDDPETILTIEKSSPTPQTHDSCHSDDTKVDDDGQKENILDITVRTSHEPEKQDTILDQKSDDDSKSGHNDHEQQQQQQLQQPNIDKSPLQSSPQPARIRHREFLQNGTTFKEVIPFSDQKLVDKIHQTYRVQYLQSSVLPPPSILEENAYNSLANILFFNKAEIVSMIQENTEFLQELFSQIISQETGSDRRRELVIFLREYCLFSQTIQPKQRESFFNTLTSFKILTAVEVALSSNDPTTKSAAIDIFTHLVEYSPHMTRQHAREQHRASFVEPQEDGSKNANILKLLIEHITTDPDPELGTATQLSCIIKLILEPENMLGDIMSKHSFLELFSSTCLQSLVEPIMNATTSDGHIQPSANDRWTAQLLSIMLDLLTFLMDHPYYQQKNYFLTNDLLSRIISLIKSRHKFLVLSKYQSMVNSIKTTKYISHHSNTIIILT